MNSTNDELAKYLKIVENNFDILQIVNKRQEKEEIKNYYLTNHFAYLLFHNKQGFMHMGISNDTNYKKTDLLTPLKIVNDYIHQVKAKNVLELGSGNGSNSAYLADLNSKINFVGIDLSKMPLKKNKKTNYTQQLGDYHDLSMIENNSMDLVFVIEALCHSNNKQKVLQEAYKKLSKGGLFIIIDGYYRTSKSTMTKDERLAAQLTEKAMAVDEFENVKDFEVSIKKTDFKIIKTVDYSQNILPTLKRFKKQSLLFYSNGLFTKLVKYVLPDELTRNSIAGLLMPTLIEKKIGCYYLHVLKK